MNLLLDTHIVLWALSRPDRLGSRRDLVADVDTTRLFSAVVAWEVAIKTGLGRLDLGSTVTTWVTQARRDLVAESLPVSEQHAATVADLPSHHRDPFDRLLIAQAMVLGVPIVSADHQLAAYDVEILLVE